MTRRVDRRSTEQDRAIVVRIEAGATRKAVAAEFSVTVSQVHRAERLIAWEARGHEMLAADPESLEGFRFTGELDGRASGVLSGFNYHFRENIVMERVSDVAGAGRAFFVERCTARTVAILDAFLASRGVDWSDNPRVIKRPDPPKPEPQPAERGSVPSDVYLRIMNLLGRLEGELEVQRKQIQALKYGCDVIDGEAERVPDDLERDGNLICLPGVSLSKVLDGSQGDRP